MLVLCRWYCRYGNYLCANWRLGPLTHPAGPTYHLPYSAANWQSEWALIKQFNFWLWAIFGHMQWALAAPSWHLPSICEQLCLFANASIEYAWSLHSNKSNMFSLPILTWGFKFANIWHSKYILMRHENSCGLYVYRSLYLCGILSIPVCHFSLF